ncbi:hypothetical protein [Pusillimonas sp.]|uniref:hypothetical protein n=1 Tax=Pusillimonas sp. TaxID=3040095 RepID=UPI0029B58129|nr:hypothetical protein [Pusillimonas sp.]MDX3895994.1 hypothetical protein [Pusillimonas sp.]
MATKRTASKSAPARKRASRKAESIPSIDIPIRDVLTALLKERGIKEGFWMLDAQMGTGRIPATTPEGKDIYPATIVVLEGVSLVRVEPDSGMLESANTIDASKL